MKITKSLAIAAGFVIGGLNVYGQTMHLNPEQAARKETTEMKTYVIGITPDEERQILIVETYHSKCIENAKNTISDKDTLKAQIELLYNNRDVKIKAILTADQFKEYMKVEKVERYHILHNSRWPSVYYV